MRQTNRWMIVVAVGMLVMLLPWQGKARRAPESFAPLVETLTPSVVNISTTQKIKGRAGPQLQFDFPPGSPFEQFNEFFEQFNQQYGRSFEREAMSLGSGVIIDPEGYIVTNHHVVKQADEIKVILYNDDEYTAEIIGTDPKTDLALIKIEPHGKLPVARFGDSDAMHVGDWVLAIGNPFGLGGTVTAGIISARARDINAGPFDDFLQTDAAINRGNSGGPLFNLEGEIVGINSAIFSPTGGNIGIGFAIPSALVQPVIKQLRETGEVRRAWLGVKIQTVTEEIAESLGLRDAHGAMVLEVTPGSPADAAGLRSGDIILSFDGKSIKEMRKLPRAVAESQIGRAVELKVWRQGREQTIDVTLGRMEDGEGMAARPDRRTGSGENGARSGEASVAGMQLVAITPALRQRFRIDPAVDGVLVIDLERSGPAARKGIRGGDVITRVNDETVRAVEDVRAQLETARRQGREHALLRVVRRGEAYFVTIPTGE